MQNNRFTTLPHTDNSDAINEHFSSHFAREVTPHTSHSLSLQQTPNELIRRPVAAIRHVPDSTTNKQTENERNCHGIVLQKKTRQTIEVLRCFTKSRFNCH